MKTKKLNRVFSRIMLVVISLVLAFSLFGCDNNDTLPAPEVKDVAIEVEEGYALGEKDVAHTLSYTATSGSTVEVSVKKGDAAATSADYSYTESSKEVTFKTVGKYTVTVKATMNGVSDEESVTVNVTTPAPELSDITFVAQEANNYGRTGKEHVITYTVSKGSTVSNPVVKKDGEAATAGDSGDYTYTKATNEIVFHKHGDYEVTISAEKNGEQVKKSAIIYVSDLNAPYFVQAASIAVKGTDMPNRVGSVHTLSYEIGQTDSVNVSVKLNGEAATAGTDYIYTKATKEIVFLKTGNYEVIVLAIKSSRYAMSVAAVEIIDVAKPVVANLRLIPTQYGYFRGEEIGVTYEVCVPQGAAYTLTDCQASIAVQKGMSDGEGGYIYADMTENNGYTYKKEDDKETLKFSTVGKYKVIVNATVTGQNITGTSSVTVDVLDFAGPSFEFSLSANEAAEGTAVNMTTGEVTYDIGDNEYSGGINVEYQVLYREKAVGAWSTAEASSYEINANDSTFTPNVAGYFRITKKIHSAKGAVGERSVILHATPDESRNPFVLGTDPFGGTYDKLIPSVASMLYFDVKNQESVPYTDYTYVSYSIESSDLTAGTATIANIGGNTNNPPYIIIENFSTEGSANNNATGTVVVRMTVENANYSKTAVKTFTVENITPQAYFTAAMAHYGQSNKVALSDNLTVRYRENMCITKGGVILNRTNAGWLEGSSGSSSAGEFLKVTVTDSATEQKQWQVDFKLTIYGFANDKFELKSYFHVGKNGAKGTGNMDVLQAADNKIGADSWISATNGSHNRDAESGAYRPSAADCPVVYVRFTRTIEESRVKISCLLSETGEEGSYKHVYSYAGDIVTTNMDSVENIGAPLQHIRMHRGTDGSCYAVENFTIKEL